MEAKTKYRKILARANSLRDIQVQVKARGIKEIPTETKDNLKDLNGKKRVNFKDKVETKIASKKIQIKMDKASQPILSKLQHPSSSRRVVRAPETKGTPPFNRTPPPF